MLQGTVGGLKGKLVAEVTYSSKCEGGGSKFEAVKLDKKGKEANMYVLKRHAAVCATALETSTAWTGEISAAMPAERSFGALQVNFIAFPPEGEFELFMLKEKPAPAGRRILAATEAVNASAIGNATASGSGEQQLAPILTTGAASASAAKEL